MSEPSQNSTRKAGSWMMILACSTLLGLLVLFFNQSEKRAYNPNSQPNSLQSATQNTVILQRNRYHHYITQGTINEQEVVFLLDTGATDVVVPEGVANQLQLKKGHPQRVTTANGQITVYRTQIDQLSIGSITLYDVNASINPYMNGEEILLGMSALKSIEFTQRGDQLTLKQYR